MKYCIKGNYKDSSIEGNTLIEDADLTDLKDFIMYGMPGLIQDVFDRLGETLKEKAKKRKHKLG